MSERIFDRETILDLTVNIIPLGIIVFFTIVFLATSYWEFDPFITLVSMGLLVVPFVGLALLTYVSGRAIEGAEQSAGTTTLDDSLAESGNIEADTDDTMDTDDSVDEKNTDDSDTPQ